MKNLLNFRLPLCLAISLFFGLTACEKDALDDYAATPNAAANKSLLTAENAPVIPAEQAPVSAADRFLGERPTSVFEKPAVPFRFQVLVSPCYRDGVNVSLSMDKPENYRIWWEVDGKAAGHDRQIPGCISGKYAQVWVMRIEDGVVLTKKVELPDADPTNN